MRSAGRLVIAVDGKAVRGANKQRKAPHLVAALALGIGAVLGQVAVNAKSNEIPAVRDLLKAFTDLAGAVAPAPSARQASRSPGPPPWPSPHPPFPGRPAPGKPAGQRADAGKCTLSFAVNVKPSTGRLRGLGPWAVRRRSPPSVAVRAKSTVPHTAPWPRFPSAMRPWTPQHNALQRDKVTYDGTEQKRPASARIRS